MAMTDPTTEAPSATGRFRRFAATVGEHVDLDLSAAGPDSDLRDGLGFDSLAMAEVLVLLAELGVHLPDELVPELRTLGDLYHYATVLTERQPPEPAR
jgi:acyl carrier protein